MRRSREHLALAAMLVLSACAKYEVHPVNPTTLAQSQSTRTLDSERVAALKARIAPDVPLQAKGYDRLWILAAILSSDPKVAAARSAVATAGAQAKAQRNIASPILTLTGEYANDPTTASPWLIGGAVDIPIDAGGRRTSRLRAADVAVEIARYDFAETVWAERMAARRALIDHFIAVQRIVLERRGIALRERQLASIEQRLKSGDASNIEVEPARLALEASLRDLKLAQGHLLESQATIAAILGVSTQALADAHWLWPDFETPAALPDDISNGDARIGAITTRADVLKALSSYDGAEAVYRGEIAKQYPAFAVSPGYIWERGLVKLPLSIGLTLPPLDLNRHAIAASIKARDEAGKHLEEVVAAAGGAIDFARIERTKAMEALRKIRRSELPIAQTVAERASTRLRLGDIDRIGWIDAQAGQIEALKHEIDALERVQIATAALEDAMRKPLEGPETMVKASALDIVQ